MKFLRNKKKLFTQDSFNPNQIKIMKMSIRIIYVICVMNSVLAVAQSTEVKNGDANYNSYAYSEAIVDYEKVIHKGNGTIDIYKKLGDCYFFNSDLENAAKWYMKMMEKKNEIENDSLVVDEIGGEHYFRASQSLKYLKKYKMADSLMLKVQGSNTNDLRATKLSYNPFYIEEIRLQSGRYMIENLPRNSAYVDFAPSIFKNQLVFSSSRGSIKSKLKRSKWTRQPYLDLYSYTLNDSNKFEYPKNFSKALNSRLHESTSSFSKNGNMVYFTRNNLIKSKFGKDSTGVNRLKIYRAKLDSKSEWTIIEDLPFNSDQYSVAHPSLSEDGKKLYFASDMPGGYGMSDLYVVNIEEDGTFGTPQNLGSEINTEGRETFPFISTSGRLYFASDGHLGLGGLDIFTINFEDTDKKVYNVGEPINSSADDVTFIINEETKKGYFASNRPGGRGSDDIYSFVETKPLITKCDGSLKSIAIDESSGKVLPDANVTIKDDLGIVLYSGKTDGEGIFETVLDCADKEYTIIVEKEDYDTISKIIATNRNNPNLSETLRLKNNLPEKGIDLAKLLNLKPIYFASNKALILGKTAKELDKVVVYMKEYPSIKIEIGSHTDSRGSDRYNMKLSQKRALSTANYIISKGINPSKVKSRGYGETVLMNKCSNGVRCSKDEHAQNRRSEFIVISN